LGKDDADQFIQSINALKQIELKHLGKATFFYRILKKLPLQAALREA
jgi:hypothetical protein